MQRTPRIVPNTLGNCPNCIEPDEPLMAQCELCQRSFHPTCANLTKEQELSLKFICRNCQEAKEAAGRTIITRKFAKDRLEQVKLGDATNADNLNPKAPIFTPLKQSKAPSRKSQKSNDSATKRQMLELRLKNLQEQAEVIKEMEALSIHNSQSDEDSVNEDDKSIPERKETPRKDPVEGTEHNKEPPSVKQPEAEPNSQTSPLTTNQILFRHAINRDLPEFRGNPEEWPLFISAYKQSTKICGYTNDENLVRLQKSLKGTAKDMVVSQLCMPSSVPNIIQTLEMIFGRPEYILNVQIEKLRKQTPVKSDKLETLINFSVSVDNLCATMEASQMNDYLNNPLLMQELLEKLPPNMKLDWASFRSRCPTINLITFQEWLHEIAERACSVMLIAPWKPETGTKPKEKHHVNVHVEDKQQSSPKSDNECKLCHGGCKTFESCKKFQRLSYSEKWDAIREYKICRCCLKAHPMKYPYHCRNANACGVNGCDRKHHKLMHNDTPKKSGDEDTPKKSDDQPKTEQTPNKKPTEQSGENATLCSHVIPNSKVQFRYLPVLLSNKGRSVTVMAFLDEGSSGTYLEKSIAEELNLEGPKISLCLKWTKNQHRIEENSMKIAFSISGTYTGAPTYSLTNVQTVESLDLPVQSLDYDDLTDQHSYLSHLPVKSYKNSSPQLLIGLNNWRYAIPLKVKEGTLNQPMATKCRLGWAIFAADKNDSHSIHHCNFHDEGHDSDAKMHMMIKEFFSIESMGVKVPEGDIASKEEQRAKLMMEETTKRINDRYETGLLWKFDNIKLPNSRQMAIHRLNCLEARLKRNPVLLANVKKQMSEYLKKGYIRKVTRQELQQPNPRIWYLPMFPTSNPNKPEKTRLVWDAAAKSDGTALNSVLMKGPDQLSSLLGILIRFRRKKIAITGDIAEMFHQVRIFDDDQHAQRFLWRDCDTSKPPDEYLMQVMTFGATCSPASAQFVKNFNANQFIDVFPRAVTSIVYNHYVDDMLECTDTVQEAIDLAEQVTKIHHYGGFHITKWKSNSRTVMEALGESPDVSQQLQSLNLEPNTAIEKVLGMWWNLDVDCFTYSLRFNKGNQDVLRGQKRPTKREVLRILMSIYDPLGLIAYFLSYLKVLLQEIWSSRIDWDDEINDQQFQKWLRWVDQLKLVELLNIPRCYLSKFSTWADVNKQIHIFVDASQDNCAAVAYLRLNNEEIVDCTLIAAKTKVAPLKLTSIPRLELVAALLGARLARCLLDSFSEDMSRVQFWSDSQVVLKWINSDAKRLKGQFVAFRVAEIQELTNVSQWRFVSSKMNVADEATKWSKVPTFDLDQRWFKGPEFLYQEEENWPEILDFSPEILEEEFTGVHHTLEPLISFERFSSWDKLLKTAAFIYRFVNIVIANAKKLLKPSGPMTSEEYRSAEAMLIRQVQYSSFPDDIKTLRSASNVSKWSVIRQLSPYLDERDVLRSRNRTNNATVLNVDTKRLIILPQSHVMTSLIILKYHVRFLHQHHETVVNELRKKYHIPKLRQALKKVVKRCQHCKNNRASPSPPKMSDLPVARLSPFERPFTFTGVDYFGPMNVKVGRRIEKRWGCLFTCLSTRAIHLEVAYGLSTDAFLLCFRNFLNRRGPVSHMYSDNGTNFVGAEKVLKQALKEIDTDEIVSDVVDETLEWHFNPPASPHMGGSWERMVKSVKNALYAIKSFHTMTDPLLNSYLIEVENIINSRPLTYLPLDADESEALTPNHFIRGSGNLVKPIGHMSDDAKFMKYNWQNSQLLMQRFWKRWVDEYLPTLTRRSKWCDPVSPLEPGDIVIICDEDSVRNSWLKGRVVQVNVGKDGQSRSAVVQTKNGLMTRPAVKLAKLDVKGETSPSRGRM